MHWIYSFSFISPTVCARGQKGKKWSMILFFSRSFVLCFRISFDGNACIRFQLSLGAFVVQIQTPIQTYALFTSDSLPPMCDPTLTAKKRPCVCACDASIVSDTRRHTKFVFFIFSFWSLLFHSASKKTQRKLFHAFCYFTWDCHKPKRTLRNNEKTNKKLQHFYSRPFHLTVLIMAIYSIRSGFIFHNFSFWCSHFNLFAVWENAYIFQFWTQSTTN